MIYFCNVVNNIKADELAVRGSKAPVAPFTNMV